MGKILLVEIRHTSKWTSSVGVDHKQVVMSLGHNMAQTSAVTAGLRDVLTEFVHNKAITPEEAQKRLADAADAVR